MVCVVLISVFNFIYSVNYNCIYFSLQFLNFLL